MNTVKNSERVDFNEVKKAADVERVLAYYDIHNLKQNGNELIGWCPLSHKDHHSGHGKDDSFSFNMEKKVFQCFSCKARGSILDFVNAMEPSAGIKKSGAILNLINQQTDRAHDAPIQLSSQADLHPYTQQRIKEEKQKSHAQSANTLPALNTLPVLSFSDAFKKLKANEIQEKDLLILDISTFMFVRALD